MAQHNIYRPEDSFGRHIFGDNDYIYIYNILVALECPNAQGGIMFVAHYDSWPGVAGASDNMVGACILLETIRTHTQNDSLANNLYFLFTDAHELGGGMGARQFVENNPEFKDKLDLVIEVDGFQNWGIVLFDVTRSYNHARLFRNATVKPIGFSVLPDIIHSRHHSGCHTAFLQSGYEAVAITAIGRRDIRHTSLDTIEKMSDATAWHGLLSIMSIVDYFANNPLDEYGSTHIQAVYFPLMPYILVVMRQSTSNILGIIACILALIYCFLQTKRKLFKFSVFNMILIVAFLATVGSLLLIPSISYLIYIPLLAMSIMAFLEKWSHVYIVTRLVSILAVILVWMPLLYLFFVIVLWHGLEPLPYIY